MAVVSAIIPALDEERWIGGILSDLNAQKCPPDEIIVVDSGSKDKTREIARKFGARIVSCRKSIPASRNAGARAAKGTVLAFFDADVRVGRDFLQQAIAEFEIRRLGIACPHFYGARGFAGASIAFFNAWFYLLQGILPSGAGMCMIIRKEALEKAGWFDESCKFEDIEFIRRGAARFKYGILRPRTLVSGRRFRRQGGVKTLAKYLILSFFFSLGLFKQASFVEYEFGKHNNLPQNSAKFKLGSFNF